MKGKTASTPGPLLDSPPHERLRRRIERAVPYLTRAIDDPAQWSKRFVLECSGWEKQMRRVRPWYSAASEPIYVWHGGRIGVINSIANTALALIAGNDSKTVSEAALEATEDFLRSVRRQYDRDCGGMMESLPTHLEWVAERLHDTSANGLSNTVMDIVHSKWGLVTYQPIDDPQHSAAPESARIRWLRESMADLTPLQRKCVELRSGGMTFQDIADEVGHGDRTRAWHAFKRGCDNIRHYIEKKETA